jgi:hypothetical protein
MEAAYWKGSATAIAKYQEYKSLLKMKLGAMKKSLHSVGRLSQVCRELPLPQFRPALYAKSPGGFSIFHRGFST